MLPGTRWERAEPALVHACARWFWRGDFYRMRNRFWKPQEEKGGKTFLATRLSGCFRCFGLINEGSGALAAAGAARMQIPAIRLMQRLT